MSATERYPDPEVGGTVIWRTSGARWTVEQVGEQIVMRSESGKTRKRFTPEKFDNYQRSHTFWVYPPE